MLELSDPLVLPCVADVNVYLIFPVVEAFCVPVELDNDLFTRDDREADLPLMLIFVGCLSTDEQPKSWIADIECMSI